MPAFLPPDAIPAQPPIEAGPLQSPLPPILKKTPRPAPPPSPHRAVTVLLPPLTSCPPIFQISYLDEIFGGTYIMVAFWFHVFPCTLWLNLLSSVVKNLICIFYVSHLVILLIIMYVVCRTEFIYWIVSSNKDQPSHVFSIISLYYYILLYYIIILLLLLSVELLLNQSQKRWDNKPRQVSIVCLQSGKSAGGLKGDSIRKQGIRKLVCEKCNCLRPSIGDLWTGMKTTFLSWFTVNNRCVPCCACVSGRRRNLLGFARLWDSDCIKNGAEVVCCSSSEWCSS